MIKKDSLLGFVLGLIANGIGIVLYVLLFSDFGLAETLRAAWKQGFLGSLVALGAVLNLLLFFLFIRKQQDLRARGVIAATILMALLILLYKML